METKINRRGHNVAGPQRSGATTKAKPTTETRRHGEEQSQTSTAEYAETAEKNGDFEPIQNLRERARFQSASWYKEHEGKQSHRRGRRAAEPQPKPFLTADQRGGTRINTCYHRSPLTPLICMRFDKFLRGLARIRLLALQGTQRKINFV
jgi:hypothetical protein